jgi:hypothetical protein
MTMTKHISRTDAEAARRRAMVYGPIQSHVERRRAIELWNAFCAQETERLANKGRATRAVSNIYAALWGG